MTEKINGANSNIHRRSYLSAIAGVAAAPVVGSTVGAAAVDSESELRDAFSSGGVVELDSGSVYEIDGTIRTTGLDNLTVKGNGATIKVGSTNDYVLKCGTANSPIDDLEIRDLEVDLTGSGAGGRALECQARNNLDVSNVSFRGKHSTSGKGPMLVGLHSSSGSGHVSNVEMPDGGEDSSSGNGGTGILVSNHHAGSVTISDCHIGPFPDNGIYCTSSSGEVHVEGGTFENTNVAGVRLNGEKCSLKGAAFIYNEDIPGFGGQRPVRCDGGDIEISDLDIDLTIDQTEAIRVMNGAESVSIENCSISGGGARDAVSVTSGAGSVETSNIDAEDVRNDVYYY